MGVQSQSAPSSEAADVETALADLKAAIDAFLAATDAASPRSEQGARDAVRLRVNRTLRSVPGLLPNDVPVSAFTDLANATWSAE